jgi:hypothetical protein
MTLRHAAIALLLLAPAALAQEVAPNRPLAVRILYDRSGSMYPGYTPPGTEGRRTKAELGVGYFHESPRFRDWLQGFLGAQTLLGAGSVGMWAFTSDGAFTPGDIHEVHPAVPVGRFDVDAALRNFPPRAGQTTYLTETIDAFTRGFSGVVWLITDNIVETSAGRPDAEVERFFRMLNDEPRFRSVHLFKYPFRDERSGSESALAVYGIVVSAPELPASTLSHFDRIFSAGLRDANGRGGPLFPGREHLKLKNLRIDPLELRAAPTLTLLLDDAERGIFKEGQRVQLGLTGDIKSNLTQHSVTAGRYDLSIASPFVAEEWARRDLGVQPLPADAFEASGGDIDQPIPPNGTRQVRTVLHSSQPVSFTPRSAMAWLRLALNGAVVKYTGTVRMSFTDVNVRLERARMAGIFGIDRASGIFDFQDVRRLDEINPSQAEVSFALRTGGSRTALFLALLLLLAAIGGAIAFFLSRRQWYRVTISGTPERLVPLRRLGSYSIVHESYTLGRLTRGLGGDFDFAPVTTVAAFRITPSEQPDTWDVRFREGRGCQLSIVAKGGKRRTPRTPKTTVSPPAFQQPPVRPLPKIDRP